MGILCAQSTPLEAARQTKPSLSSLQQNPNVLWVGELEVDYFPEYSQHPFQSSQSSIEHSIWDDSKVLKLVTQEAEEAGNAADHFIIMLMKAAPKMTLYQDADLTQQYTGSIPALLEEKELLQIEKAIHYQHLIEKDFYEGLQYRKYLHGIRVRQWIYYDQERLTFDVVPLALAPLVITIDGRGVPVEKKATYWIDIAQLNERPNLRDGALTWAKRLYKGVDLTQARVLKATQPLEQLAAHCLAGLEAQEAQRYLGGPHYQNAHVELEQYPWHLVDTLQQDSIITFDPDTFEEVLIISNYRFDPTYLTDILLLQEWYWDDTARQVGLRQMGFGFVARRPKDNTIFTYFIRLPHLDKLD